MSKVSMVPQMPAAEQTDWNQLEPTTQEPYKLFDVTCVIGSVYSGKSDFTPREVAFLMIARAEHSGTYRFPDEDGTIIAVDVSREEAPK